MDLLSITRSLYNLIKYVNKYYHSVNNAPNCPQMPPLCSDMPAHAEDFPHHALVTWPRGHSLRRAKPGMDKGFRKTVRREDLSRKKCLLEGEKSSSQSEYLVCLLPISSARRGEGSICSGYEWWEKNSLENQ